MLDTSEEEDKKDFEHPNSPEEQLEITEITTKVNKMYEFQTRTWREFNDRTLKVYVDDSEKRINSYVVPRNEDYDDWQTKGFEGITREKMFAFVSKVAMSRPRYKFKATKRDGQIDRIVADVVSDMHEYSVNVSDPTGVDFFFDAWAAAGHGTVIRYEGIQQEEDVKEEFDDYDIRTGEIKGLKETVTKGDINCMARRVRLLDFLWYDWHEPNIQKQPCIAEVVWMNRFQFESVYGDYYNADKVPLTSSVSDEWGDSFYMEQWKDLPDDMVQVTFYYEKCKGKTKFRILANGVMILATPIPRKDGKYPYSRGIFKPFADDTFFCGKSLPDEIAWDQDQYNAFKNMMIDRAILHIQRPLITDGTNEFTDVFFSPSKVLSMQGNVQPLDIPPPGAADMQVLDFLRESINRQSSDAAQSGAGGSGSTAREIVIADEHARKLAGVFRLFLEKFDYDATQLRIGNILQFYLEPSKIDDILDDKTSSMLYRTISVPNKRLTDGATGTKIVNIVGSEADIPAKMDVQADVLAANMQGVEIDKVVINAEYIKKFNIDVLTVPESSFESSRSLRLAMENEYQQLIATLYPEKFKEFQDVFFRGINEIYDKDMSEFDNAVQKKPQANPLEALLGGEQAAEPAGPVPNMPISEDLAPQAPTLGKLSGASI